jgi:agmatine deiminase
MNQSDRYPPRGFHMPAEWVPHEATWLSWPHNPDTWPGALAGAEAAMARVVIALAPHEHVHINVQSDDHRKHVRKLIGDAVPPSAVTFHLIPTNDAWIRDHGAIFVTDASRMQRMALDFYYNAWGGKYPPFDRDQEVAGQMASVLGIAAVKPGIVLEGGSIDVNGAGCVLTTEQCLLNPNRNPTLMREGIEEVLRATLGVDQVVWLGDGIEGDDTDGHIDDITRFVAPMRIVTAVERNERDPNHGPLAANRRFLEGLRIGGEKPEILELPMPEPQRANDERLPASYANFYIANGIVLLPVFSCPQDAEAVAVLRACSPDREIHGIDARALVQGLGAIHCLTQQVPARGF